MGRKTNAQNAVIAGDRFSRVTRLVSAPKHNSWPAGKRCVREWIAAQIEPKYCYEVYGTRGSAETLWTRLGARVTGPSGEALAELAQLNEWGHDVWDIDCYSRPYPALEIIGKKAKGMVIGVFATDTLKKQCQIRGGLAREVTDIMEWPRSKGGDHKHLKAWIYYHHPQVLREIYGRFLAPRYSIRKMIVVGPRGVSAASYVGLIAEIVG